MQETLVTEVADTGIMTECTESDEGLRSTFIFDNGMLPFLKPGSQIQTRSIPIGRLRIGDLVAYGLDGYLRVRRVVQINHQNDRIHLLLKGDNRFGCDRLLSADELAGVASLGHPDKHFNRIFHFCMARISYFPFLFSAWVTKILPKGKRSAAYLTRILQPLLIYNSCAGVSRRIQRQLTYSCAKTQVRNYGEGDLESVVHVWNRCFPDRPMDTDHFKRKICGSTWFSHEGCFVAVKDFRVIGFVLASERRYRFGARPFQGTGFIECIGVDPEYQRLGIGSLLAKKAIRFLKRKNCLNYQTGHFPVDFDEHGWIRQDKALGFFGNLGFEITDVGHEVRMYPSRWDYSISRRWASRLMEHGIEVRLAQAEDRHSLQDAVQRWRQRWHYPDSIRSDQADGLDDFKMSTYVVAIQNSRILGYCRAVPQDHGSSYEEFDWIWDASIERGQGSVGFLYVDPEFRSLGLGAALISTGISSLFERGCTYMWGHTNLRALRIRYKRWGLEEMRGVVIVSKKASATG